MTLIGLALMVLASIFGWGSTFFYLGVVLFVLGLIINFVPFRNGKGYRIW